MNDMSGLRPIGFWGVWGLTVGTMIGSGIFLLPSVLAPYGWFSLVGWAVTTLGAICLTLVMGRLAARSPRSGGPAIYVKDSLGDLAGFFAGWSLWISYVIGVPAVAIAFAGYVGRLLPGLSDNRIAQVSVAGLLIVGLTLITIKGIREATRTTLALSLLKLLPFGLVVILAIALSGSNPVGGPIDIVSEQGFWASLASVCLLTMWAFLGLEAGLVASDHVIDPRATLPRAAIFGVITVAVIYVSVTIATMKLVPAPQLAVSEAPLVDAARSAGPIGTLIVVTGAMVATAGTLLAMIFVGGHIASGMARDGLAPKLIARKPGARPPVMALGLGSALGVGLLAFNLSDGLLSAFTLLLTMSTSTALLPYLLCALADLKSSWRSSTGWALLALVSVIYSLFALAGSGLIVLLWGLVLLLSGLPVYWLSEKGNGVRSELTPGLESEAANFQTD